MKTSMIYDTFQFHRGSIFSWLGAWKLQGWRRDVWNHMIIRRCFGYKVFYKKSRYYTMVIRIHWLLSSVRGHPPRSGLVLRSTRLWSCVCSTDNFRVLKIPPENRYLGHYRDSFVLLWSLYFFGTNRWLYDSRTWNCFSSLKHRWWNDQLGHLQL